MSPNFRNLKYYGLIFYMLLNASAIAQEFNASLEYFSNQKINFKLNQSREIIHTGFKPVLLLSIRSKEFDDSLKNIDDGDEMFSQKPKSRWLYRKLRNEGFFVVKTRDFDLVINPLLNLEIKSDNEDSRNLFTNTRGIELKGKIANNIYFYSSFYENQARYETYVNEYISNFLIVPGQGAPKFSSNNKLDFSMANAFISFSMGKFINLQFGHSKHFIGEGYRSLLLSDNAFNYPFLKLSGVFGKFKYVLLWGQHELFNGAYYHYHSRKYNSMSYLSWVPQPGLEISVFENISWPGNLPEKNNFSINLFNPMIFWRTIQYGLDNDRNSMLGFSMKIKLYNNAQLYGQCALDKTDRKNKAGNNFAVQLGIKQFDILHLNSDQHNLFMQFEYNFIAPYTYSHRSPIQSHTHYNQPLAHPTGSGLKEFLGILDYSYKDFSLKIMGSYIINSLDTTASNFGSNIFLSDRFIPGVLSHIGNKPGQGIKNHLIKLNAEIVFMINPSYNFQAFTGLTYRRIENSLQKTENLILSFGIRTRLNNYYYDF